MPTRKKGFKKKEKKELADFLAKAIIEADEIELNMTAGIAESPPSFSFSWKKTACDGNLYISLHLYTKKNDKSHEVFKEKINGKSNF
jgi:hypothetical protein